MATGISIALGVLGVGLKVGGTIAGASQAAEDARVAEEFANTQYDITTGNIYENLQNVIDQSQEQASLARRSQTGAG